MVPSLKEALGYRGCPICWKLDKDELDFMCSLQGALKEEKIRQVLASSNGFCNFHFHEMARLTSPLVIALVASDMIDKEIEKIERETSCLPSRSDCPVCEFLGQRDRFYLEECVALLHESCGQREYEKTDGLCRIHMEKVLNLQEGNELSRVLRHTQLRQLWSLRGELLDFISKGGRGSQRMGREKNSWWVALQKWVGKRGLPGAF